MQEQKQKPHPSWLGLLLLAFISFLNEWRFAARLQIPTHQIAVPSI
jgi:hypothetical protein